MRYISLFSGIEAASCAWEGLGWEPVAFSEIDPFASAVLDAHYPNVPNLGDITEINWKEVSDGHGTIDLIVGGSPCQSFSIAGSRASLDGESRLMFEFIRAIREVRPRWLLWENVPGALSAKGLEGEAGGGLSNSCSGSFANSGTAWRGEYWTRNTTEWPSDAAVCSLSDVLEAEGVPPKYFLSPTACNGILRRAEKRGKSLPSALEAALREQAGRVSP